MKLLLTSGGIRNESMRTALTQLLGGPTRHARLVFVVTAAVAQSGDHGCLVDDLNRVYGLGWRQFNVLEINGLPPRLVRSRLADSDVIYAEGGNAYHLARSIADADLGPDLLSLLAKRVYVGASAGSMIFARHLTERLTGLFGTDDELYRNHDRRPVSPFNFFGWFLQPHVDFTSWNPTPARELGCPVYAIDDQTAIQVVDDCVDVVSEGAWKLINGQASGDPTGGWR